MLTELSAGPAPLMFPGPETGLAERVRMAASHAVNVHTFNQEDIARLREEGRPKADFQLPNEDAYLEMWGQVRGQARAIGILYSSGAVMVATGEGWPGVRPKVLPGVLSLGAGGVLGIECAPGSRAAVFHAVAGFSGDVLRCLDAVARKEG